MRKTKEVILKTFDLLSIIILYYIIGNKSIFLYVLSLSLYNIYLSCFSHITIKDSLKKINNNYSKTRLFKSLLLILLVISFLFLLLGILISDIIGITLKINNLLPVFIAMGLTILTKPFIKLLSEYLISIKNNNNFDKLNLIYDILDKVLLLFIALFVFRVFKLNIIVSISLLYLPKIISVGIIIILLYLTKNHKHTIEKTNNDTCTYQKEIKKILTTNSHQSIIRIVKNSYYYISIIILYLILSTIYNYKIDELEKIITFIYFYALAFINYLIYLVKETTKDIHSKIDNTEKIYYSFKMIITISIVLSIISPLTCKIIFLDAPKSIYLVMANFLAIIILLYDMTFKEIRSKKIIYLSLIIGLIFKIILIIPLINAFYRLGYNLIYGDILSTIIAMLVSVIINHIYLRKQEKYKHNYFEKILDILYDNIILAIILILCEFIIPIDTKSYFKSLGLIIIYLGISITYIKLKNKKRG